MQARCPYCFKPLDKCQCDDLDYGESINEPTEEDADIDEMKRKHPGHSDEAYRTGRNLGVDFPYVPGDPFW